MNIANCFLEPRLKGIDLTGPKRISAHRDVLRTKPILRQVVEETYHTCVDFEKRHFSGVNGIRVELGAGTSLMKDYYPDTLITDIEEDSHLDAVVDAQKMPFENGSVKSVLCISSFHHFPDPHAFFLELLRVLPVGGGCVLYDPAGNWVSQLIYERLFSFEGYDRRAPRWGYLERSVGGSVPNQALSHLVFDRDLGEFSRSFPELEVVERRAAKGNLRFLLSGGLSFRQLIPDFLIPVVGLLETALLPFEKRYALHHYIVLKKVRERV